MKIRSVSRASSLLLQFIRLEGTSALQYLDWSSREFSSPSPQRVKWRVLRRWGGVDQWIEAGTFLGETTAYLSSFANFVYSIEANPELAQSAANRFRNTPNIEILKGSSELELMKLLDKLPLNQSIDVTFWLDGHYSSGITFRGLVDTPILVELQNISKNIGKFERLTILVDDIRCFGSMDSNYSSYLDLSTLVEWADLHDLFWTIEHDIFIMTNRMVRPY